jgi:hypothetical protein
VLAFPWIPLAESGLFKGLQRIQIKKSAPAEARVPGCRWTFQAASNFRFAARLSPSEDGSIWQKYP